MPEFQNIAYKPDWHDDYLQWVCGFANAYGGIIFGTISEGIRKEFGNEMAFAAWRVTEKKVK